MTRLVDSKRKHVYQQIDMAVDFTNSLASGETLSSAQSIVVVSASHGSTTDITLGSVSISGNTVTCRISGGTALKKIGEDLWETEYTLRAEVITSSGERESEAVELIVYESVGTGS
jgi:hypothetical protein